jgi:neutral ceramidase
MNAPEFCAGVARRNITPETSIWMSGYAYRDRPSEGAVHPLWAKALAIEDRNKTRIVIVATDLIGLPREMTDLVSTRTQQKYGIERSRIMFNSTHTHSGPVVWPNLMTMFNLGREDEQVAVEYSHQLGEDLFSVIGEALADLAPAQLSYGFGEVHFAVNRRELTPEGVRIGINRLGPIDPQVPVLRILSEAGRLRAVVFGYACHNTASSGRSYQLSGDYAGFSQIELEKRHPGVTAMFITLCGGDQNPNPLGSIELAWSHGKTLAAEVNRVLGTALSPVSSPLRTAFQNIQLKFAPHTKQTFENELKAADPARVRRANAMLRAYDEFRPIRQISYPVQALRFGPDFTILALAGEVVVAYSLRVKKQYPGKLVVAAYSNDVMSYIPSRRILQEGGYEAVDSMIYYGLPGPYTDDVEDRVLDGLDAVMSRVGIGVEGVQTRGDFSDGS